MQPYAGSISSTYLDLFSGIAAKDPCKDYVFLRSDVNTYTMYVGDLTLDGDHFSGDATCYQIVYDNSYQSNYYNLTQLQSMCSVDVAGGLVYSNLGYYPTLTERGSTYDFATLFLLVVCCCVCLFNCIFNAIRR